MLNSLEEKVLNHLELGENIITVIKMSEELNISRPCVHKYLKTLEDKGFITKTVTGYKGGTTNDKRLLTTITRYK